MAPRVVFIGDSITDGFSYPLLVLQALHAAGQSAPVGVNAGISGDTAAGMRTRLDRDVLAFRPQRVTLSIGVNQIVIETGSQFFLSLREPAAP